MLMRKASNNQLHFGISEMLIWHTSDKTNVRTMADLDLCIKQTVRGCQWKKETEVGANDWTCCTMQPSTTRYVSLYKSQNLPH